MRQKNSASMVLGALSLVMLLGCEVPTSVRLAPGPSFSFDGSGRLVFLQVYGPRPRHKIATPVDHQSVVWSIELTSNSHFVGLATGMKIVYGKVPRDYVQKLPSSGTAPPLAIGQVYILDAETTGAPGVNAFFYMDRSGPVMINVPGLCGSSLVGDVKPVRCGTGEPYVEPKDLEKFVQENRIR